MLLSHGPNSGQTKRISDIEMFHEPSGQATVLGFQYFDFGLHVEHEHDAEFSLQLSAEAVFRVVLFSEHPGGHSAVSLRQSKKPLILMNVSSTLCRKCLEASEAKPL